MAKTKPIGVRFDEPTLNKLKDMGYISPQSALSFLEKFWVGDIEKIVVENNKPENKKRIIKERDGYNDATNPLSENECFTPKTLQELKTLCPKELTGLDRSEWIANKRQEYNI